MQIIKTINKLLSIFDRLLTNLYRPFTKLAIGVILLTIFFISCVQIIDRRVFHEEVKKIAKEELRKDINQIAKDSSISTIDSVREKSENIAAESNNRIIISNVNANNSSPNGDCLCNDSSLDILSKSDALLDSNGLTFCVTLIVSLLAALLLYRIETMEILVEENKALKNDTKIFKDEIKSYYTHALKFNYILSSVGSAYNQVITICNLPQNGISENDLKIVGHLCSRLSLICSEIDSHLNDRESRLDYLTKDEKEILDTYLEDAIGELMRVQDTAKRIENNDLLSIIKNNTSSVKNIMDMIDHIEMKN